MCGQVTTGLGEDAVRAIPKAATHLRFGRAKSPCGADIGPRSRATCEQFISESKFGLRTIRLP